MDFTFSEDQEALRASVRAYLDGLRRSGRLRASDSAVWAEVVELGWPGLLVPEDHGGIGLGLVDAVVVLEEMGRATFEGPFLSSAIAATIAADRLARHDLLEGLTAGAARGTIALDELGHDDPVDRVRTRAKRRGSQWRLTGLKPIVLDGHGADWVIVAARTQDGLSSFLVERPECEPVPAMDPTRAVARLDLDDTPGEQIGPVGDHTAIWRRIADDTGVALAAELVGVCDGALAMAIDYAGTRVQFDVPLSSHQVIQHKLVDMLHGLELGRVGVHHAAWASDVDDASRSRSAAIAKAAMSEAAVKLTADNIQIHGAVGFTWESEAHLFYKRAKQNDVLLGSSGYHRQRVADAVIATGG